MIVRKTFPQVYTFEHPTTGKYWLVSARSKRWGMNERKSFDSERGALDYARQIEETILTNGAQPEFPSDIKNHASKYAKLLQCVVRFDKTPEDAVDHYIKFLGDELLRKAMPSVGELVEKWKEHKFLDSTIDSQYKNEIKVHCRFIKRHWGDFRASELRKNDIETTLKKHPGTNNTRRKYLMFVRMFFNWVLGLDKEYVLTNPANGIKFKSERFEKAHYTPEEIKEFFKLLREKFPDLIGYYAILTFCGLRPSEGARVTWNHVNFKTKQLHVIKGKTDARHIDLEPVALQWLQWFKDNSAKDAAFVPQRNLFNLEREARKIMDTVRVNHDQKWVPDGLRHSFATFFTSLKQDEAKVAWYMGNSIAMIKRHYARKIDSEPLKAFWNLTPNAVFETT